MKTALCFLLALPALAADTAMVHIYMPKYISSGLGRRLPVRCDGSDIAGLKGGYVFTTGIPVGQHDFITHDKQYGVRLNAKSGDEYYLRIAFVRTAFAARFELTLVPPEQGRYETEQLKPADDKTERGACGSQPSK